MQYLYRLHLFNICIFGNYNNGACAIYLQSNLFKVYNLLLNLVYFYMTTLYKTSILKLFISVQNVDTIYNVLITYKQKNILRIH